MTRVFIMFLIFFQYLSVLQSLGLGQLAHAVPAQGHKIMITAPSPYASEVGRKIYSRGGNVVDVAVAVGLTLSVTSPYFASLGGGGFAMIKMNKTSKDGSAVQALDFRETAPKAAGRDFYKDAPKSSSQDGGMAVGVPGFPAGLWALHQKYGKLAWADLFNEAMLLAKQGFNVSGEWVETTNENKSRFDKGGQITFFKKNMVAYLPGETLKQPGLVKALQLFKAKGLKGFYEGDVAKDIVDTVNAAQGKFSLEDLKNYKVRWLSPLETTYEDHKVYLMPPPSSGGVIIAQALKLIERLEVKKQPTLSVNELHLLAEIEARAFRGRSLLGDPDFHKNPVQFLTSEGYLQFLTLSVNPKKVVVMKPLEQSEVKESAQTTHYSVMDSQGNAVSLTVTLNGNYGSGLVSEKFGLALNNEMDDFTTRPGEPNMYGLVQGSGNDVQAGKRPLSSMSPTIIEKNGKTVLAIGAPGGPRIITGVLQGIYRIIGRGTDIDWAIQAPRVHHQFMPPITYVDMARFSPEVIEGLRSRGHKVEDGWMAKVQTIRLRPDGILEGAFDSRAEGSALGL